MRLDYVRSCYNFAVGCLALLAATTPSFAQTQYTARVIEDQPYVTPWDYRFATPRSINDFGEVVGSSFAVSGGHRGFHWTPSGQWVFMGDDPALQASSPQPNSINNGGTISGTAIRGQPGLLSARPAVWQSAGSVPSLLSMIGESSGGQPLGRDGYCNATNASQLHVGAIADGGASLGIVWNERGEVIRTVSGQTDLPGHFKTSLDSVNDQGLCLGNSYDDYNGGIGFVYDAATKSFTVLDSSGYYLAHANQINGNGFSVGFVQASRTSLRESALWSPANVRITVRPGSVAKAINDFQVVVGDDYDISGDAATPYVWDARYGARDLNDLLTGSPDFTLRRAFGINNYGQIVATGTYKGHDAGILLTPVGSAVQDIAPSDVRMTTRDPDDSGGYGSERDVVGIACDNNAGTLAEDRNCLVLTLPASFEGARIRAQAPQNGGSFGVGEGGKITYFPPDEFNENQSPENADGDLTKDALRPVNVTLFVEKEDGSKYIARKEIWLARPPVVLVHGISSDFTWSKALMEEADCRGLSVPFAHVSHSDSSDGNGPIEYGAIELQRKIHDTLTLIREGQPLPNGKRKSGGDYSAFDEYEGKRIAIRRADVVAWSYGGAITRWYLASDGIAPHNGEWYRLQSGANPSYEPTDYLTRRNIRKVITLGTMWRGVPLCNYENEAMATDDQGVDFTFAPFAFPGYSDLGAFVIRGLGSASRSPLHMRLTGPAIEVMAVDSPWMCWMLYGQNVPPKYGPVKGKPFRGDVAYGSVAGDDNRIFGADGNKFLDTWQNPSWFPYLKLETANDTGRNYSDGIVPVWSAAIPGSYVIAPCDHLGYASNRNTQDYVFQWLNRADLPTGDRLNLIWQDSLQAKVRSFGERRTWSFKHGVGEMAPEPQAALYEQRGHLGRMKGSSLQEVRSVTPRVGKDSLSVVWTTLLKTTSRVRIWSSLISPSDPPLFDVENDQMVQSHSLTIPFLSSKLQANKTYYFDASSEWFNAPDPSIFVSSNRIPFRLGTNQVIIAGDKAVTNGEGFQFTIQIFNNTDSLLTSVQLSKIAFTPEYQLLGMQPQGSMTIPAGNSASVEVTALKKSGGNTGTIIAVITASYLDPSGKRVTITSAPQRIR